MKKLFALFLFGMVLLPNFAYAFGVPLVSLQKAVDSPVGNISLGGSNVILGKFTVTALNSPATLEGISIDLSSNSNATGPQNTSGFMECNGSLACDLTGAVKIFVDTNNDDIFDFSLLATTTSPNPVSKL